MVLAVRQVHKVQQDPLVQPVYRVKPVVLLVPLDQPVLQVLTVQPDRKVKLVVLLALSV
jgi:hypothetical protein